MPRSNNKNNFQKHIFLKLVPFSVKETAKMSVTEKNTTLFSP